MRTLRYHEQLDVHATIVSLTGLPERSHARATATVSAGFPLCFAMSASVFEGCDRRRRLGGNGPRRVGSFAARGGPGPGLVRLLLAALIIGAGTGLITPLAFAALAEHTAPERLGQTMGSAELGRELGDAGGPLLVGAVATAATLTFGYTALALIIAIPVLVAALRAVFPTRRTP